MKFPYPMRVGADYFSLGSVTTQPLLRFGDLTRFRTWHAKVVQFSETFNWEPDKNWEPRLGIGYACTGGHLALFLSCGLDVSKLLEMYKLSSCWEDNGLMVS